MSASIAISSAALASSTAANIAAQQAREAACQSLMATYDAKTATVAQQRGYADCVRVLHPPEITGAGIWAIKFLIVLALMGVTWGAIKGWKEDGMLGAFMLGTIGLFGAPTVGFVIGALGFGVVYLFVG